MCLSQFTKRPELTQSKQFLSIDSGNSQPIIMRASAADSGLRGAGFVLTGGVLCRAGDFAAGLIRALTTIFSGFLPGEAIAGFFSNNLVISQSRWRSLAGRHHLFRVSNDCGWRNDGSNSKFLRHNNNLISVQSK